MAASQTGDQLTQRLQSAAQTILTIVFGLLPILFIPLQPAPLEYTKVLFVIGGIALAFIFFSLSVLRSGSVSLHIPYTLWAFWGIVLVGGVSALLSGDIQDALIGNVLGIHTVAFTLLLAATMTVWTCVGVTKKNLMRLYLLFVVSTFLLTLFHVARMFLGADFLSLGIFNSAVASPIGGWNDLALFLGLTILLALVILEQLPIQKWGRVLFGFVVGAALLMLIVINFFFVWVVLGVACLVLIVYTLSKDGRGGSDAGLLSKDRVSVSLVSLVLPVVVFVVSALFVLGGSLLSGKISEMTNISYVEVRPSVEATADIAKGVYSENAFTGIGPNRFADAWRLYKDESINETIFWNTNFQSGSGYITTAFVNTGVLGGIAWLVFLILFVIGGLRMLLRNADADNGWYFIATSSFVGALFVWGMSLVYVPGSALLLIGALCTGLTFVAQGALNPSKVHTFTLFGNRRGRFVLTLLVMAAIIGSVGVIYGAGRHYAAAYTFASGTIASGQEGASLDEIEQYISSAYELIQNDAFARRIAEYQLARINALASVTEPTQQQQQQFQAAIANGVNAARLSTQLDESDPINWAVLGRLYGVLVGADVEQSYELGRQALERARDLDPHNPARYLQLGQLEYTVGNTDAAYELVRRAISLKSNYSDALFFLSQMDIASGNVEGAIATTRAMISFEPQNPSRYYQLGVLQYAEENHQVAAAALEEAVRLDADYANARYFLALAYSQLGRSGDAEAQLTRVLELNPGNEIVMELLSQLEQGGTIALPSDTAGQGQAVEDESAEAVNASGDDVVTDEAPDTPLVSPVNTPAESETGADTEEEGTE